MKANKNGPPVKYPHCKGTLHWVALGTPHFFLCLLCYTVFLEDPFSGVLCRAELGYLQERTTLEELCKNVWTIVAAVWKHLAEFGYTKYWIRTECYPMYPPIHHFPRNSLILHHCQRPYLFCLLWLLSSTYGNCVYNIWCVYSLSYISWKYILGALILGY